MIQVKTIESARKIAAIFLLIILMLFSISIKHDTSPLLEVISTQLIDNSFFNPIFIQLTDLGFLATEPVWLASKLYFLFNITLSFTAIILFFYSKKVMRYILLIMLAVVSMSFILSTAHKFTAINAFQVAAYQLISLVVYPFTAILLIPIFELGKKIHAMDKENVELKSEN